MGVFERINNYWKLMVLILICSICTNGVFGYRIIEWSTLEGGSGSGENMDGSKEKSKTNFIILNNIDGGDSTTSPIIEADGGFEQLRKLNPGLKIMRVVPTSITESNESKQQLQSCIQNNDCSDQQTCNLYSRKCERCRLKKEICRRDGNCCGNMKCLWGRCMTPKHDGTSGSICKTNLDCGTGMCCAKEHGVSVCKRYLTEGEECEVPAGGLVFSIHHSCPCIEGLRCKVTKRTSDFVELKGTCVK